MTEQEKRSTGPGTAATQLAIKAKTVRDLLEKMKPQIAMALPRHMTADRMSRVAMTCVLRTPKLLDCEPVSLAGAIVTCSQLGLEPDPLLGLAYLVPFKNRKRSQAAGREIVEVVVIPGYKGLMKLAWNSGQVTTIDPHTVHEKDDFRYTYGLTPMLSHVPYQGADEAGPATHYYAVARLRVGEPQFIVLTLAEVEAHRARFARSGTDDSPWQTDFDAMAMKTCIRRLAKYLPSSPELQRAVAMDERAEAGLPQDIVVADIFDLPASAVKEAPGEEGAKEPAPDPKATIDLRAQRKFSAVAKYHGWTPEQVGELLKGEVAGILVSELPGLIERLKARQPEPQP